MTRTQVLQEIRQMRFEEACRGWQARRLTKEEAARLLGGCERTFRCSVDRYEDEGLDGLADKRLGEVSARRAPIDEIPLAQRARLAVRTETLYRERYEGWNVKRFYSFYRREHAGTRSYTVRLIRQTESLPTGSLAGLGRAPCADRAPGSVLSRNR